MRVLIYTFFVVGLCFLVFFSTRWIWSLNRTRRRGLYPQKGKATMFDVRQLIVRGEKDAAVRLYCEIFQTSSKEARKAVEELEQSINEKKSDQE